MPKVVIALAERLKDRQHLLYSLEVVPAEDDDKAPEKRRKYAKQEFKVQVRQDHGTESKSYHSSRQNSYHLEPNKNLSLPIIPVGKQPNGILKQGLNLMAGRMTR